MEYITHEGDKFVRVITLYGRYYFGGFSAQYLCWYEDESLGKYAGRLVENDYPDMDADIIFEKAINPIWGPGTYVCVKCDDYYRENLTQKTPSLYDPIPICHGDHGYTTREEALDVLRLYADEKINYRGIKE